MADYFYPQDWVPLPRPVPRPGLTQEEKLAGRSALVAAQASKDSARAARGLSRLPLTWDEALHVLQVALPSRTNDELQEAMVWAQDSWHPGGTTLYEVEEPGTHSGKVGGP